MSEQCFLARISHTQSTAAADLAAPPARPARAGAPGLLNVPYSTFAGADPRKGAVARLAATAISTASLRSGVRIAGLGDLAA